MESITDLKIVGIDESRPPVIRKEPYIELYFKLNRKAPLDWVRIFNDRFSKEKFPVKIKPEACDIVETWVRTVDEVEPAFEMIKAAVRESIEIYLNKILAMKSEEQAKAAGIQLSPEQIKLNAVISHLKFDR
jgi:hypothetical protein